MPRSRRRHHSRSRSRTRSHSHERDREVKRRKIDALDSPTHKRSVSVEPTISSEKDDQQQHIDIPKQNLYIDGEDKTTNEIKIEEKLTIDDIKMVDSKLNITPQKTMSPKHIEKKFESEKKRQQKQLEKDERERKKEEEKIRIRQEKLKQKVEKEVQKQKLIEQKEKEKQLRDELKRKEREERDQKRKEKEEREEQKRKERELEKLKKQEELNEKNKEKQKQEEQKQKAAAAFVNFFKKAEVTADEKKQIEDNQMSIFMPFEIKSGMRLAPNRRRIMSNEEKENLVKYLNNSNENGNYLNELKHGVRFKGRSSKTWPSEDLSDGVIIVEDDCNFGETICEDKYKLKKMRAKFLKFHENRRPPYFGTWQKRSTFIKPRKPFGVDKQLFEYDIDSDEDWEEEEQGESLRGSDDEEKDDEAENDDYEVDNEFFVPHGHLSDDEIDEESTSKLSPESHKQKLKLLKDAFDQDMQHKTHRLKPRSIGCIWYDKIEGNVDEAIDRYLRPLAMITNSQITIRKRNEVLTLNRKSCNREIKEELIPVFLKMIHGNSNNQKIVVQEFVDYLINNDFDTNISKTSLAKFLKQNAQWRKCPDDGPMLNKYCWNVNSDLKEKFNVDFVFHK